MSNDLRTRWVLALRASGPLNLGRECDYARAEGDADRFDALGLLAVADDTSELAWRGCTRFGEPGAWLPRRVAATLFQRAGLDPALLGELVELNDDGWNGNEIADWVSRQ
jgi:hypothetical protein